MERPPAPEAVPLDRQLASVSGVQDPAGEAPWAMQLVVHVPKSLPPDHDAACRAAARAVVGLLDDERAAPGGEWYPAVRRWNDGRIRKHVRRARGSAWQRAAALPGSTVTDAGAEVRAFVPTSTDEVPAEIAKLQLQGLDLARPDTPRPDDRHPDGVVVSLSADPVLPTGKAAAAAGHAAQLAWMQMDDDRRHRWRDRGFAVVVEHPELPQWEELVAAAQVVVRDAGFTVVAPGTVTALARWS
jgi:peptidyl-tRNA hydrolase